MKNAAERRGMDVYVGDKSQPPTSDGATVDLVTYELAALQPRLTLFRTEFALSTRRLITFDIRSNDQFPTQCTDRSIKPSAGEATAAPTSFDALIARANHFALERCNAIVRSPRNSVRWRDEQERHRAAPSEREHEWKT